MRKARLAESLGILRARGLPVHTVLDVGVQYGTPPLVEAFPDKRHVLFEPIAEYHPRISTNYSEMAHSVVGAAVSDTDGEVHLSSERKSSSSEISHSYIVRQATNSTREVQSIRLDTFLANDEAQQPYLLKIDVEGADIPAAILRGALKTLSHTSAVVIEMTVDRFMERAALLDSAGFDLWDLVDLCYYDDCLWQTDAIFVNRRYKSELPMLSPMHQTPFRRELWQESTAQPSTTTATAPSQDAKHAPSNPTDDGRQKATPGPGGTPKAEGAAPAAVLAASAHMGSTREHIKISVVTPNYNGEAFLEKTIWSVLSQNYPNLEYIIVDGGSTDASMSIVEKYAGELTHIISEPDQGHADAVNKGFALASGDAMAWLNSDDMLFPGSLSLVNELFSQFPEVDWVTGRATSMLENDIVNRVREARPWSWLRFLCGDYRHIQQEGTFWRRRLWERAGSELSLEYSLANDFDLWTRFFRYATLYSVDTIAGCFRFREGQRSIAFGEAYDQECHRALDALMDATPAGLLARFVELMSVERPLHPSFDFPSVPTALAVADPPIISFDHRLQRFTHKKISPLLPCECEPAETVFEDMHFDGSERIVWREGPDFTEVDLVGLDVELRAAAVVAAPDAEFTELTPPALLIGPLALYQLGSSLFSLQMKFAGETVTQTIDIEEAKAALRLKVLLGSDRYAVIVNGKTVAAADISGEAVGQSKYARLGGGYLSRYWEGSITSVAITSTPRATREADFRTVAISHRPDVRNLTRERRADNRPVSGGRASGLSDLTQFRNLHRGQRCFVMGNGPSLNKMDLTKLREDVVFACNAAFLLFDRIPWRPRYYTCVDSRVIRDRARDIVSMLDQCPEIVAFFPGIVQLHDESKQTFDGRSIIPPGDNRYYFNEIQNSLVNPPESMFSLDLDSYVVQPYTVAITMLQFAAYMGFSEVYLIGCDTNYRVQKTVKQEGRPIDGVGLQLTSTKDDDVNHFDPGYFGKGREWHNPQVGKMIEHHRWAKEALRDTTTRVFNATVGGRLEVYPRVDFNSLF